MTKFESIYSIQYHSATLTDDPVRRGNLKFNQYIYVL